MPLEDEKFPETIPAEQSQWATLCTNRSPEFKVHNKKGLAHSAIAAKKPHAEIAMYELKEGLWTKVWEYEFPTICSECGGSYEYINHGGYRRSDYKIPYGWEGSIKDAPVICLSCYKKAYVEYADRIQQERELAELARLQAKHPTYGHMNLGDLTTKD